MVDGAEDRVVWKLSQDRPSEAPSKFLFHGDLSLDQVKMTVAMEGGFGFESPGPDVES